MYAPFTKETGLAVKVVNLASPQMLAQIKQGRPQSDLVDNSTMVFGTFASQGALEKLDFDRIKSFKGAKVPDNRVTEFSVGVGYYVTNTAILVAGAARTAAPAVRTCRGHHHSVLPVLACLLVTGVAGSGPWTLALAVPPLPGPPLATHSSSQLRQELVRDRRRCVAQVRNAEFSEDAARV